MPLKKLSILKKKYLTQGSFAAHALTLMTGTIIAQAIPVAVSPILTRIYSPSDFGLWALFISLTSIISIIATARYELTIILPEKDEDAINLVALSIVIAFAISFVVFLIVLIFNKPITRLLGNPAISRWLYFIPFSVLLTGIFQALNCWSNRRKKYARMARRQITQSVATVSTQLCLGVVKVGSGGLLGGGITGQAIGTGVFARQTWKEDKEWHQHINKEVLKNQGSRYLNLVKYLNLSHLIGALHQQLPILILNKIFDSATAGFFSLANRILSLPISILADAMGVVFRQRASEEYAKAKKFDRLLLKTVKHTFLLSLLPFCLFMVWGKDIFLFVFGKNWGRAGEFASILAFGSFFAFVINPVDKTALIVEAKRYILFWHIGKLIAILSSGFCTYYFHFNIITFLWLIVMIHVSSYVIDLFVCWNLSKGKP